MSFYISVYIERFTKRDWLTWLWSFRSPNVPSGSWRSRKASGIIPSHPRGPRTRSQWGKSQSGSKGPRTKSIDVWGQKKVDVPAQTENKLALVPPFCSIEPLNWIAWHAHPHWWVDRSRIFWWQTLPFNPSSLLIYTSMMRVSFFIKNMAAEQ